MSTHSPGPGTESLPTTISLQEPSSLVARTLLTRFPSRASPLHSPPHPSKLSSKALASLHLFFTPPPFEGTSASAELTASVFRNRLQSTHHPNTTASASSRVSNEAAILSKQEHREVRVPTEHLPATETKTACDSNGGKLICALPETPGRGARGHPPRSGPCTFLETVLQLKPPLLYLLPGPQVRTAD